LAMVRLDRAVRRCPPVRSSSDRAAPDPPVEPGVTQAGCAVSSGAKSLLAVQIPPAGFVRNTLAVERACGLAAGPGGQDRNSSF
jgi:hypothetical protein